MRKNEWKSTLTANNRMTFFSVKKESNFFDADKHKACRIPLTYRSTGGSKKISKTKANTDRIVKI